MYEHDESEVEVSSAPSIQSTDVFMYRAADVSELPDELAKILENSNSAEGRDDLDDIFNEVTGDIDNDRLTMEDYLRKYERSLKLARMVDDTGDKTFPFVGASRVMMPYVLEAAMEFWARTVPGFIERKDICMIETYGKSSPEMDAKAERIAEFVNYDLRSGIKGWRESQSRAMLSLPIVGMYFKKTWHSPVEARRKSQVFSADQIICDHTLPNFCDTPRKSYTYHLSINGMISAMRSGQFLDIEYDETCEGMEFTESHCLYDLDGDGYKEPYIITICNNTSQVVSIVPRFSAEDVMITEDGEVVEIEGEDFFTCTTFIPDPSGTWVGMGWGVLLGDMFEAINTNTRQMIDAGTLNNIAANSGFIAEGGMGPSNRKQKGKFELKMGQFTSIPANGPINQSIWQPQFAGPSSTLFELLQSLKEDARRLVTVSQNVEGNPNEAAELYLARLQQSLKLPQAIMINVYNGVTKELERLLDIYRDYLTDDEYRSVLKDDEADLYGDMIEERMDIKPTADPTQGSEEERVSKALIVLNEAKQSPVHDLREAYINYYKSLGVSDYERYLPPPQPNQPDPLQVMQAEAAAEMGRAEKLKGIADMMTAQARMLEANIAMQKAQAEIEKIESETIKNLSDVDAKQAQTRLDILRTSYETARGVIKDANQLIETYARGSDQANGGAGQGSPSQPSIQGSPFGI